MFELHLNWDRPARTGPQATSHTLRIRISPQNRAGLRSGLPVSMAIALDTSGSMAGDKLARSTMACAAVVSLLRPQDSLWLAGFATDLTQIADGVPGGSDDARAVLSKIDRLSAVGVTRTDVALQWIDKSLREKTGSTRVGILITDGNPTDPMGKQNIETQPLIEMAGRLGQSGVTLCAVGLGNAKSYNAALLAQMSDRGRGAFLYADSPDTLNALLSTRLSASQTIATADGVLEIGPAMAGISISSACRFRPEYLPLEPVGVGEGWHIELGSLRSDIDTDILLNVDVPGQPDASWSGARSVVKVRLTGHDMVGAPDIQSADLTNTTSYADAQRRDNEIEKDRLSWDVNLYSDALIKVQEQSATDTSKMRKTGQLLSNIEQSARRAGNEHLANDAASQVTELRRTGKLDAHRATGLLVASRSLGADTDQISADLNVETRKTGALLGTTAGNTTS
jgi:Ca-activated chloride channel homolog